MCVYVYNKHVHCTHDLPLGTKFQGNKQEKQHFILDGNVTKRKNLTFKIIDILKERKNYVDNATNKFGCCVFFVLTPKTVFLVLIFVKSNFPNNWH